MVLVYATANDAEFDNLDVDAATITRRITTASALVRKATRSAYYDTTPTGAPSDEDVAEGFRQATVTQVLAWDQLGVDPSTGPAAITGQKQSQSLLGGSVTYAIRPGADQDKVDTITTLVPAAAAILWDLTQLPGRPFVWQP